ncbi:hypothetical protein BT93_H0734 [Corymbia citriodora subsp. variegata]|nr:hypothetical protein BT93_H0734 [Corymbia citriodora subsp. variegata]
MVKSALHQQPLPMVKWPTRATPDAMKFSRLVAAVSHLQMSDIEKEGFLDIASRYLR